MEGGEFGCWSGERRDLFGELFGVFFYELGCCDLLGGEGDILGVELLLLLGAVATGLFWLGCSIGAGLIYAVPFVVGGFGGGGGGFICRTLSFDSVRVGRFLLLLNGLLVLNDRLP